MSVHVISRKALSDFWRNHRDAQVPLSAWFKATRNGAFRTLAELKRTFGSVDYVPVRKKPLYVFSIGGNKYRLIAAIHFNTQKVFVRYVLTHKEYDLGAWKK